MYDDEAVRKIKGDYFSIRSAYNELTFKLIDLDSKLKKTKAREYLREGVRRRLGILHRCISNIFDLFPVDRKELLTKNELSNMNINLHAFFINISGILDNLAWVFVHENGLWGGRSDNKLSKFEVGLFKEKTQLHLGVSLNEYLKSDDLKKWYDDYSKDYRDALAHRIPLYVPPAALNEGETKRYKQLEEQMWDFSSANTHSKREQANREIRKLGKPCFLLAHSYSENCKHIMFHAQVIADFRTIEKITTLFCDDFTG